MPRTHYTTRMKHTAPSQLPERTTVPLAGIERAELQRLGASLADVSVELSAASLVLVALRQWAQARIDARAEGGR